MGIFSKDEEPDWSEVFSLQKQIQKNEEKLQWIKDCINNYLSEKTIDNINSIYYRDWMLNVRNKIISVIEEKS